MSDLSLLPANGDIGRVPGESSADGFPPRPGGATEPVARKTPADVASPVSEETAALAEAPTETAPLPGKEESPLPPDVPWPETGATEGHDAAESAVVERMKAKYGSALVADVDDAQILLSYVTRNGLQEERKLSDEAIQTLISTRHRLRAGVFDCAREEAQFRKDFGLLAKAAAPVSVASLRDSLPTRPQRCWVFFTESEPRSMAERTCFKYRDRAMWVLTFLLISQVYWTVSSSVLNKADALIAEMNKAPTEAVYRAQEAARVNALNAARPKEGEPSMSRTPPKESVVDTSPPPEASRVSAPIPADPPKDGEVKSQLTLDELKTKSEELGANYSMLSKLMTPFAQLFFEREVYTYNIELGENSQGNLVANLLRILRSKYNIDVAKKDQVDLFAPTPFQTRSATVRAVAGQVIDVMQKWWLPLLYGALGAMVFVVRTLSLQARDRLFRKEALVALNLRVYLGMISGLAIGWFWNHNAEGIPAASPVSISALSPFALAFIAGYGVELFFTLLDKIVSAFTSKA